MQFSLTGSIDGRLLGFELLGTYLVASLPASWLAFRLVQGLAMRLVVTALLGPIFAPVFVGWMGLQLAEVRRLEAVARAG